MTEELCRLCLSKDKLKPLFANSRRHKRFSHVLLETTGLNISINDGLPQSICETCIELVNTSLKLRNQSQDAETKLKEMGFAVKLQNEKENTEKKRNTIKTESDDDFLRSIDNDFIDNCLDDLQIPNIEVSVEFDRLTDVIKPEIENGDFDINSLAEAKELNPDDLNKNDKILSRKEKREQYMNLVDGIFDPNGPVKCKVCKKTLSKWTSFLSHCKLHLGFKFVCEFCGKSFISITQLNRHCRSRHGMKRELACAHCDYMALDNTQLALHKRRVHTGERPFICDYCGASYFSRKCLIQHIENHSDVKTIQCDKCPRLFKSRRHLARHTYTAHTSKEFTYKCPICNQIYRNFKYVRVHLKRLHSLTTKDVNIIKIKL